MLNFKLTQIDYNFDEIVKKLKFSFGNHIQPRSSMQIECKNSFVFPKNSIVSKINVHHFEQFLVYLQFIDQNGESIMEIGEKHPDDLVNSVNFDQFNIFAGVIFYSSSSALQFKSAKILIKI